MRILFSEDEHTGNALPYGSPLNNMWEEFGIHPLGVRRCESPGIVLGGMSPFSDLFSFSGDP